MLKEKGEKIMKNKLFAISILLTLFISALGIALTIPEIAEAQTGKPLLRVEPSEYRAKCPCETFDINVTINNLDASLKAVSVQFRLGYNKTLLNVINVAEGPFMKDSKWNLYGTYFIYYPEDDGVFGPHVIVGVLLLPNPATGKYDQKQFPEGNGIVATITFHVQDIVGADCALRLIDDKETIILDWDMKEIPRDLEDGHYYSPCPSLKVEPSIYQASSYGEIFDINVTINDICPVWKAVIVQFRLGFDAALLEFVSIVEGDFLKGFAPYGTYFVNFTETDGVYGPHVVCGIMINPNATGGWNPPFPEGSGTLATITFKVKTIDRPSKCAFHFIDDKETFILRAPDLKTLPRRLIDGQFYMCPSFKVEPSIYQATSLGEIFNVNVTINNLHANWRVAMAQFRLGFDATLLEFVGCAEGPFMEGFAPYDTFFWSGYEPDGFLGPHVLCGIMINPNETGVWNPPFPEGSGTIATITFKAIKVPVWGATYVPPVSCSLHFIDDAETFILNDNLEVLERKTEDGEYYARKIIPRATIAVEPSEYLAHAINETFSIKITMNDLVVDWKMVAVQFRLGYNKTLLEVVDVTEGPFMKDPRWALNGTYFISIVEVDPIFGPNVLVGVLLNPHHSYPMLPTWIKFPEGDGTLATITFKAVYQERGVGIPPLCDDLTLRETMMIDETVVTELPHNVEPSYSRYCIAPAYLFDLNGDNKVDMKDIGLVARAFGTVPGHARWNPICDVTGPLGVPDGKVDMRDVSAVARQFGWTV